MELIDILLIEDNFSDADLTIRLTIRALKKGDPNLSITHLEDGAAALDYIFSQGDYSNVPTRKPKLILLDLQLPKIGGHEVLKEIKMNEKTRIIPVIILTSSSHPKDVQSCYHSGANAYMVKPLDFDEYMNHVSEIVRFWLRVNYLPTY
jgi:two-component system, response regulator